MDETRTSRILSTFHLFYYCEEITVQELTHNCAVSQKTIQRDIQLLKRAGLIQAKYSKKSKAFVPIDDCFVPKDRDFSSPDWPDCQTQKLYMEKIIRLCTLMTQMVMYEVENPIRWYREKYPELSERTRQRDFAELKKIGYNFKYEPEDWAGPGGYYYDYPKGAFG